MQSALSTCISEVALAWIRGVVLMLYSFWWTVGMFPAYIAMQTMNEIKPHN